MHRVIVTPAELGGALAELKRWLAISTTHDDPLLAEQLRAALALFAQFSGTAALQETQEEVLPATRQWQNLSAAPFTDLLSVHALGAAGEQRLLADDAVSLVVDADGRAQLLLRRAVEEERLLVRYRAGLAAGWDSLDPGIRQGVIRLAAHYYAERGAEASVSPPASVVALWRPHRRLSLR